MNQGQHRLAFYSKNFSTTLQPWAQDRYTGAELPIVINNTDSTYLYFTVTADASSNRPDRFIVVFKSLNTTPVKFTNVKATQQSGAVAVEWKVENEVNVKTYEVEKSADGIHFTKVGSIIADGKVAYNWLDITPNSGNTYYRIRMVDKAGAVSFSEIVLIKTGTGIAEIGVYPNPVVGGVIGLQLTNMPKGNYGIRVINTIGQTIFKKTVQHLGGNSTETLSLGRNIVNGLYKLEVISPDNKITVIDLLK